MTCDPDAVMVVLPADHSIPDAVTFCATLQQAAEVVQQHDVLMALGVKPTFPNTGYGYIQVGEPLPTPRRSRSAPGRAIYRETTRPDCDTPCSSGDYVWNCGIFVWRASTIWQEIHTYLPDLWQGLETYYTALRPTPSTRYCTTTISSSQASPLTMGSWNIRPVLPFTGGVCLE